MHACFLLEGGGSSQDKAEKDHSLDQIDQVLLLVDKALSSLSSDSQIRCSFIYQNLITPLPMPTIPLPIHSFVHLVTHWQIFMEHRHYSRRWDSALNVKHRIQALIWDGEAQNEEQANKWTRRPQSKKCSRKKTPKEWSSKCSKMSPGFPISTYFRPTSQWPKCQT